VNNFYFLFFVKSNWIARSSSIGCDSLNDEIIYIKNSLGLNRAEIISALAIDLLKESKK